MSFKSFGPLNLWTPEPLNISTFEILGTVEHGVNPEPVKVENLIMGYFEL